MKLASSLLLITLATPLAAREINLLVDNKIKKASIDISKLSFGNDKENGKSIAKIISSINQNKNLILNGNKKSILSTKLYFKPELNSNIGKVYIQGKSASIRLYQTLSFKDGNGALKYVPFEGAEVNTFISGISKEKEIVKNGYVSSINSSLIDSSSYEHYIPKFKNYGPHSFSYTTKKNRNSFIQSLGSIELSQLVENLYPESGIKDRETFNKQAMDDTSIVEKFLKQNISKTTLLFVKSNINNDFDLAFRIINPFDSGRIIDLNIEHMNGEIMIANHSLSKHVKVNIYTGNIFKLLKNLKVSGQSEEWQFKTVKPSIFKQEDYETSLINLSKVAEYFKTTFSWNGFDNQGSDLNATVKYRGSKLFGTRELKQNAAWIAAPYNQFLFGDGGKDLGNFIEALDVIGHEYFHAVIAHTSNLNNGGEQGALNEHLSDILGVGFESEAEKREYDYKIGEKTIEKSDKALRNFLEPKLSFSDQALHMDEVNHAFGPYCVPSERNDSCGVHFSNGVPNRAIGLSIKDFGWAKIKDIVFEVATKRLRSSSGFSDYRNQIILACEESENFSQQDCQKISSNFELVGIKDPALLTDDQSEMCPTIKDACELLSIKGISSNESCTKCGF